MISRKAGINAFLTLRKDAGGYPWVWCPTCRHEKSMQVRADIEKSKDNLGLPILALRCQDHPCHDQQVKMSFNKKMVFTVIGG